MKHSKSIIILIIFIILCAVGTAISNARKNLVPDEKMCEDLRKLALRDVSEEEQDIVLQTIKKRHNDLEQNLMWDNWETRLSNPKDLAWNEIDYLGEIKIGYGMNSEILEQRSNYSMPDEEFYEKYGSPVVMNNTYNGDSFIQEMTALKEIVNNEALKKDFDTMISLMEDAKETHNVKDIIEIHKILHDMDYYLLRYGPKEYGGFVRDTSMIDTYYGVLNFYQIFGKGYVRS